MNSAGVLEGPEGDSLSPGVVAAPSVGVVPEPAAPVPVASTPLVAVPLAASVLVASTPLVAVTLGASSPEGTPEAAGAPEPVGEALDMVSLLVQGRSLERKDGLTVYCHRTLVEIQSQKLQGPAMGRLVPELAVLENPPGRRVSRR